MLLTFDLLLNRDRLRIKAKIAAKLNNPEEPHQKNSSKPRFFIIGHDRSRAEAMMNSDSTRGSTCVDLAELAERQSQSSSGPKLLTAAYSVESEEGELWSSQSTAKGGMTCKGQQQRVFCCCFLLFCLFVFLFLFSFFLLFSCVTQSIMYKS